MITVFAFICNAVRSWFLFYMSRIWSCALFTDLSKAFDCLCHELLIAKLDAYGFDKKALKLVNSYLSNRKKRVKILANLVPGVKYYLGFQKVRS